MTQSESCCVATMNYPAVSSVHWNFPFGFSPWSPLAFPRLWGVKSRMVAAVSSCVSDLVGHLKGVPRERLSLLAVSFPVVSQHLHSSLVQVPVWTERCYIFPRQLFKNQKIPFKVDSGGEGNAAVCYAESMGGDCVTLPAPCQHRSQSLHCRRGLIAQ